MFRESHLDRRNTGGRKPETWCRGRTTRDPGNGGGTVSNTGGTFQSTLGSFDLTQDLGTNIWLGRAILEDPFPENFIWLRTGMGVG